jgi:hypothetical protein
MPLFLVRWPQMEASLISARDERELVDVIDQLDTPTACTWTEYDGPLWIDVDLNLEVEVEGTLEDATARRVSVKGREALQERMHPVR